MSLFIARALTFSENVAQNLRHLSAVRRALWTNDTRGVLSDHAWHLPDHLIDVNFWPIVRPVALNG